MKRAWKGHALKSLVLLMLASGLIMGCQSLQHIDATAMAETAYLQKTELISDEDTGDDAVAATVLSTETEQRAKRPVNIAIGDALQPTLQKIVEAGWDYQLKTYYFKRPRIGIRGAVLIDGRYHLDVHEPLTEQKIAWLQEQLKIAGYYTYIDGRFDDDTKAQLSAFTAEHMPKRTEVLSSDVEAVIQTFNQVRMAGSIDDYLVLVDKAHNLRSTDVPKGLVDISAFHMPHVKQIEAQTNRQLLAMFAAAKADGVKLRVISGYRSFAYQNRLFKRYTYNRGIQAANTFSALPGQSEHQTGLTVDIDDGTSRYTLKRSFDVSASFKWLDKNAHRYGFILSYPKGRRAETGYVYEPWHYRYVGSAEVATTMKEHKWTLKQYLEQRANQTGH